MGFFTLNFKQSLKKVVYIFENHFLAYLQQYLLTWQ